MVNAAETDIVCPAVTAEDPNALLGEELLVLNDILAVCAVDILDSVGKCVCGSAVSLDVVLRVKECLGGSLDFIGGLVGLGDSLNLCYEPVAYGVLAEKHTEAVLGVVLEQGVGPCGA